MQPIRPCFGQRLTHARTHSRTHRHTSANSNTPPEADVPGAPAAETVECKSNQPACKGARQTNHELFPFKTRGAHNASLVTWQTRPQPLRASQEGSPPLAQRPRQSSLRARLSATLQGPSGRRLGEAPIEEAAEGCWRGAWGEGAAVGM